MLEMFIEVIVLGTGGGLIRLFRPTHNPSDGACAIAGIFFWLIVGLCGYLMYHAAAA